jgi:glycerol uptake facilitator-like aquaporin
VLLVDPAVIRACVAEMIGTFALVFAGAGAVMVDARTGANRGHGLLRRRDYELWCIRGYFSTRQ